MVHVDRLVTVELELPGDFPAVESLRSDEDDSGPHPALATEFVGDVVVPLVMPEMVNGKRILSRQCFYGFAKPFRNLPQHHRCRDRLAQLFPHEHHRTRPGRQPPDTSDYGDHSTYHYHFAVALLRKNERARAVRELRGALRLNPANDEKQQIIQLLKGLT